MTDRILFLSAHFCSQDVPQAGHKLAASMLSELAGQAGHVDVVTFRTGGDRAIGAKIADLPNVEAHVHDLTSANKAMGILRYPALPIAAAVRRNLARATVASLLSKHRYDRIFVDFTQTLAILPPAFLGDAVVRVHDVLTQLYERRAKLAGGVQALVGAMEYRRARRWEPKALAATREIIALNGKDVALLHELTGRSDIRVVAPSGYYVVEGRSDATIAPGMILFWGNMARSENVDAVQYFIDGILPAIEAAVPGAHLVVGGANPPQKLIDTHAGRIRFTGFVESPDDLFRACQIGVAPLRQGAGIKIKTLEFIGSGIPTVATTVGAEGIAEHPLLHVEDEAAAFAARCVALLRG